VVDIDQSQPRWQPFLTEDVETSPRGGLETTCPRHSSHLTGSRPLYGRLETLLSHGFKPGYGVERPVDYYCMLYCLGNFYFPGRKNHVRVWFRFKSDSDSGSESGSESGFGRSGVRTWIRTWLKHQVLIQVLIEFNQVLIQFLVVCRKKSRITVVGPPFHYPATYSVA